MQLKNLCKPFYPSVLKKDAPAGLTLAESSYPPNLSMRMHSHEPAYLGIVLGGSYTENYGKRIRECKASMLIFHPPGEKHAVTFHNYGARIFRVEIGALWVERLREYSLALNEPCDFNGGLPAWLAQRLYKEFHEPDQASALAVEALTLEIMVEASRCFVRKRERHTPRWLKRVMEMLEARFAESLTLAEIAAEVGVHPVHLARTFREHTGCTIGERLRQLRVEFACREISTSDVSFAEIAATSGFADQSHFSRTLKRHTGMTPAQFRNAAHSR